jgi:hypothetical protein
MVSRGAFCFNTSLIEQVWSAGISWYIYNFFASLFFGLMLRSMLIAFFEIIFNIFAVEFDLYIGGIGVWWGLCFDMFLYFFSW